MKLAHPSKTLGRPVKYDLEKMGLKLLEWAKKDTSTFLLEFCNENDLCPDYLSTWGHEDDGFSKALKKAKSWIAVRQQKMVNSNSFNYGIHNRYIGMYDPLLHDYEEGIKDREAARRKENTTTVALTLADLKCSDLVQKNND